MTERKLYATYGLFKTPDDLIHAAKKTAESGYKKFDVNTPYPIHGMPKAMGLGPSKLGYVALAVGLGGMMSALMMMYFMTTLDYPLVIGGKPFFALPAYIPITFEVTVLSASIATVLAMLFFFFRFPNNFHPLHDSEYMKKVSSDGLGIVIEAKDNNYDIETARAFLKANGAYVVDEIYYPESFLNFKANTLDPKFLLFLLVAGLMTSGATYFTLNKLLYMPPFDWMYDQNKVIPQEPSDIIGSDRGMFQPVEGTIARGHMPYKFTGQPEEAGANLENPLLPSTENLDLGKKKFDTFCSPCHGYFGEGDIRLKGFFPKPPSLHSSKVRDWSDGRIYHVIMDGQNTMPSYASQTTRQERWAIILYLRTLQRSLNAKESDLQ